MDKKVVRNVKKLGYLLMSITMLLIVSLGLGRVALAAEETPDITLKAEHGEHIAIPDVTFHLYTVASIAADGQLIFEAPFDNLKLDTQPLSEENIQSLSNTLSAYVKAQNIAASQTKATGPSGILTFSLTNYEEPGKVYLILGDNVTINQEKLSFQPLLVQIPYQTNGNLHPIIIPKPVKLPEQTTKDLSVVKVWKNDTEQTRPTSITVGLYKNGQKQAEQVLNDANSWRHTFTALTANDDWQIVEENVPSGYTVTINETTSTIVVTNTKTTPPTTTKTPPTTTITTTTGKHLPQTGVLWWPVAVLSIIGGFSLVIGILRRHTRLKLGIYLGLSLMSMAAGMTIYNIWDDNRAAQEVSKINQELKQKTAQKASSVTSPVWDQDMSMPTQSVENERVIGTLRIDKLNLELPILRDWSPANSKIAPCRYEGSIYKNNLIIAGHNYLAHFAKLNRLTTGDAVSFEDMERRIFDYKVSSIEMIDGSDVSAMTSGKWDLTLFTCNYDGTQRLTIRCVKNFEQGV